MLEFDQELLFFPLLYLIEHLEGMNDTATWRAFQENMTGVKRFLVLEWFFTRWWLDQEKKHHRDCQGGRISDKSFGNDHLLTFDQLDLSFSKVFFSTFKKRHVVSSQWLKISRNVAFELFIVKTQQTQRCSAKLSKFQ